MFIFDFDGVLIDSVDEVVVSAYNTVTGEATASLEVLPKPYIELFRRNRCRAHTASSMPVLATWCLANLDWPVEEIIPSEIFEQQLERTEEPLVDLGERFYETRARFVKKNREEWLRLNRPYEPLWSELQKFDPSQIVILTYKNRQAVYDISHHYGVPVLKGNLYTGDGGATKSENFQKITEKFPASEYVFIDDALGNLEAIRAAASESFKSVRLYFSAWGYAAPEDPDKAREAGFLPVAQEEFVQEVLLK